MGERYVELIVTATPETVEACADFLFAEGALGLAMEEPSDSAAEILIRASFPGSSPIDPILNRLTAYQRALAALDFPGAEGRIEVREIPPTDWAQSWKAHFKPLAIGKRLIIAPPWDGGPFPEDRLLIRIDPGMSFGTGHHATTRMCLEALEAFIEQWAETRGPDVLDVGTGSGILAIAGAVLGAERVVAIDTDPEACEAAASNVSLSDVKDRIRISHAGVESIDPETRFDLALANLDAKGLCALFKRLVTCLRPASRLIASGILVEEDGAVVAAARASGLSVTGRQSDGEWLCLMLRPDR
ncbi:MAG: 50S ribosomal protein L11 methyltransferase [Candidatus Methylomirabilales bacterium]